MYAIQREYPRVIPSPGEAMAKRGDKVLQAVAVYGGSKSGKNPIFFEKATGIQCMIR